MIDTAFNRSVGNGSRSHDLLGYLIIMRTSLVVAGVKLCSVFFFRKWWFREIIIIIINEKCDRIRAILFVKYFEKELHNVSNKIFSGSAFNLCRSRIDNV